jgi:hypothetical protein
MKNAMLAISLVLFAANLLSQTIPTPTQTDEIIIDNGQPGKADPADRFPNLKMSHPTTLVTHANANMQVGRLPYRQHLAVEKIINEERCSNL